MVQYSHYNAKTHLRLHATHKHHPISHHSPVHSFQSHCKLDLKLSHTSHLPLQHGFRPLYAANTKNNIVIDGIYSAEYPPRTCCVTLDISKTIDAIPCQNLTNKTYHTHMSNNIQRWLANYLAGKYSMPMCQ